MSTKFYLSALFGACLLSACTSECPIQPNSKMTNSSESFRVSPEEAISSAKHCIDLIGTLQSRSVKTREVKSVEVIGESGEMTRSGKASDTLIYVINFQDEAGFAIISADKRTMPVYAVSDEGNFEMNENVNPGVNILMDGIKNDIMYYIEDSGLQPGKPFNPWAIYYKTYEGPYLSSFQSSLGPNSENSAYCRNEQGQPALTSRVAIVLEQFISSQVFTANEYHWTNINAGNDADALAKIIKKIGDALNLSYYDINNPAKCEPIYYYSALEAMGFLYEYESPKPFDEGASWLRWQLENSYHEPVLLYANGGNDSDEALWVIDGYAACMQGGVGEMEVFAYLYHCVWGDGGTCNGYYYINQGGNLKGDPDFTSSKDKITNLTTFKPNVKGAYILSPVHERATSGI